MTQDLSALVGRLTELAGKWTPGPWEIDPDRRRSQCVYSDDATGSLIARTGGKGFEYVNRARDEEDANAALIALAPDMAQAILDMQAEVERLRAALEWYGENARLARLIHSGGDSGRAALANDGGKRAIAVLTPTPSTGGSK
jgi:hypothetical protein